MPFDSNPTNPDQDTREVILARLGLLLEIAEQTNGYQGRYETCLYAEVQHKKDMFFADHGGRLDNTTKTSSFAHLRQASAYFGFQSDSLWGPGSIEIKRTVIKRRIQALRDGKR